MSLRWIAQGGRPWNTRGQQSRIPRRPPGVYSAPAEGPAGARAACLVSQAGGEIGSISEIPVQIKSIEAKYAGLEDFMIHWAEGLSPKELKEQLRWFARDVMPAFRKR